MTNFQQHNPTERIDSEEEIARTNASRHRNDIASRNPTFTNHICMVQTAQIALLERENVIDNAAADAILRAIDTVHLATQPVEKQVWTTVSSLEDRIDAALPGGIAGAASLGRTRSETIATALRMQWRDRTSKIASQSIALRAALHELASAHTVTVMGVFADRKAAAPSTLAHFLGGVLGPLESTWGRLRSAVDALDRSPLGAGLVVGEVFSVDRVDAAKMLGFREPIENSLDASGAVEDIVSTLR